MELLTADQRVPGSNPVVPSGMSGVKAMRDLLPVYFVYFPLIISLLTVHVKCR